MKKWITFILMLLIISACALPVSAAEAGEKDPVSSDEQEILITISVRGSDSTVLIRDEKGKILEKVPVHNGKPYVHRETVKELATYTRYISQEIPADENMVFDTSEYKVEIVTYLDKENPVSTTAVYRQDKKVSGVEFVNQPGTPVPKTGDDTPVKAMILLAVSSAAAIPVLIGLKRKAAGKTPAERK